MTFKQLYNKNNPKYNGASKYCVVVSSKAYTDKKLLSFYIRTTRTKSRGKNIVHIQLKTPLMALRKIIRKSDESILLKDCDVRVRCTCEAFKYWGAHYNLSRDSLVIGKKEKIPPLVRDPNSTMTVCKHIARVYKVYANTPIYKLFNPNILIGLQK